MFGTSEEEGGISAELNTIDILGGFSVFREVRYTHLSAKLVPVFITGPSTTRILMVLFRPLLWR